MEKVTEIVYGPRQCGKSTYIINEVIECLLQRKTIYLASCNQQSLKYLNEKIKLKLIERNLSVDYYMQYLVSDFKNAIVRIYDEYFYSSEIELMLGWDIISTTTQYKDIIEVFTGNKQNYKVTFLKRPKKQNFTREELLDLLEKYNTYSKISQNLFSRNELENLI